MRAARQPTQRERREATIEKILQATLLSLGEVGYSNLSISLVSDKAEVSRGAVFHHFATKRDLVGAAMRRFFDERYDRLMEAILSPAINTASVDERLDLFRRELTRDSGVSLEIFNAIRTDESLREFLSDAKAPRYSEQLTGYIGMFPEAGSTEDSRIFIATFVAFLRGMCIQEITDAGRINAMFEMMRTMVHLYFAHIADNQHKA
ncbi:MAG: TetR/AcrR family transcriptional regulator [Sphingobium sp.]|nr:TetR/AcrR family transcriptional regulator [Sphingobium sp.]